MILPVIILMAMTTVFLCEILDLFVRPVRYPRLAKSFVLRALPVITLYAMTLTISGSVTIATAFPIILGISLLIGSNIKQSLLGEPLVFSDLVVAKSFILYPRFYIEAISPLVRAVIVLILLFIALSCYLFLSFSYHVAAIGFAMLLPSALVSGLALYLTLNSDLMGKPALESDIRSHGLLPVLLVYWLRWRAQRHEPLESSDTDLPLGSEAPGLVIVVQCESFADIPRQERRLPAMERGQRVATSWGNLLVSGFGAYTMRTEFGVLCGVDEETLSFRRYDPFLTAKTSPALALANKLAQQFPNTYFVHPHDMRFYDRKTLMPALGFKHLIGETSFSPPEAGMPYVSDAQLGETLISLARSATEPTLIYAVTMENHGPWQAGRAGQPDPVAAWEHHIHNADALLGRLIDALNEREGESLLVFFGDHRPTIPGHFAPAAQRHTPYLAIQCPSRVSDDHVSAHPPQARTPAELHRLIVELARSGRPKSGLTPR